jgi:hypothetical protein
MHRIIGMGSGEAETVPQPRVEAAETPEEKLTRWMAEIFGGSAPLPALLHGSGGVNMEAIREKEKPSDVVRQQAEDRLEQTIGLSHWSWCWQSLALLRGPERGPAIKINGLFIWKKRKSLILHESCGRKSIADMIYMGEVESSCAYWVPLRTGRGRPSISRRE